MQAIVYHHYGPPDVLSVQEIPVPTPAANEVLIRVHAASVNPYDRHFMRGAPRFIRLMTGLGKPKSPRLGADAAGVVEAVGSGVTRFKPGDAVFGAAKGAFADYACAKEDQIALKPDGVSFEQAASVPIAGITALQALRDSAKLKSGQRILINGAAGGVGTFAVQIARIMGASITGICSARNAELLLRLGARRAIDYASEDFTRAAEGYDVLFDLVGNRPLNQMRRALQPHGIFVGCGGGGPETTSMHMLVWMFGRKLAAPFVSQKLTGILAKVNPPDLELLAEWIQSGKLTPVLDRTYPLAATADAIRHVETGHARGKVIIHVA